VLFRSEAFEYDADNQLTRQVSKKDTKTTTTEYLIQPGDVPFIKREMSVTVDSVSETEFDERVIKSVDVAANEDESLVVRITETREWWEGEGAATTPVTPEPDPIITPKPDPTPSPVTLSHRSTGETYQSTKYPGSMTRTAWFSLQGGRNTRFTSIMWTLPSGFSIEEYTPGRSNTSRAYKMTFHSVGVGTYQIPFEIKATDDYFAEEKTWNRTITVVVVGW
jgi:hypothetical protein